MMDFLLGFGNLSSDYHIVAFNNGHPSNKGQLFTWNMGEIVHIPSKELKNGTNGRYNMIQVIR